MGINQLIVPPTRAKQFQTFTTKQYAETYIGNMSEEELKTFKKMLKHSKSIGAGVAKAYNVSYEDFIKEVHLIIGE